MTTTKPDYRIEHDSMGELQVPEDALWGAQTQRAIDNFAFSDLTMSRGFIRALGLIKRAAARANHTLGVLDNDKTKAIVAAADAVAAGDHDNAFPVDVFQTGSGTSSNMNANEVIANLATASGVAVHPNDHVNLGQSSNDVIPTAIHVAATLAVYEHLLPSCDTLAGHIETKAAELDGVVKTGRTHLMDAMPLRLSQELSGWQAQIEASSERLSDTLARLTRVAQGGTAVGTGINTSADFAGLFCHELSAAAGVAFSPSDNYFASLSAQDTAVELSGQLRTLAVSLMKISNDLRWMNSGPLAGLGEIALPSLQPGSSIMPGKVNPVIPEAVCMIAAQVIGNDATIAIAGQSGNFQLNVMLPVIAHNLLQSIELLAHACDGLGAQAIAGFTVNTDNLAGPLRRNPILVTALNPHIGYELGAAIAKKAYKEGRPIQDVAREMTNLDEDTLQRLLEPDALTRGGIVS